MKNPTKNNYCINNLIEERWSNRAFNSKPVKKEQLQSILEAINQGLHTHQMSGFDANKAVQLFNIPDDFQAVSVTALGYYGNVDNLPEDMAMMEAKPRERKDINEIVFSDKFGNNYNL